MRAPKPNSNDNNDPLHSTPSQKQKSLSIHIATDHVGPNKMPLVYGSTPDKVGYIRGSVRFSTNYPCKGKDIVIMYEAKAEAQWSAFENKKLVKHQTEEILGYHIWHFPLEHTKPGGSTVAIGDYQKEFEIPLIHPSVSLRGNSGWSVVNNNNNSSNNNRSPSASSPSSPTLPPSPAGTAVPKINSALPYSTQTTVVNAKPVHPVTSASYGRYKHGHWLLPSSSYSPQARIKYTIHAILQRPFPSITHVEASQEIWVLNSSLPPNFPLTLTSLSPSNSRRSHSNSSSKNKRQSSTKEAETSTDNPPSTPASADKIKESENEALSSQILLSLPMPSQVLKSALALLPSIDLSRSKQFFPSSKSTTDSISMVSESGTGSKNGEVASLPSSQPLTSANTPVTVTATAGAAAPIDTATTRTDTMTSDTASEAGSSSGKSSVSSPRLDGIFNNNNHYASLAEVIENENIADYTGVWEAFDIPYSLSLPSEMVYLGQAVPLTIRFGPQRGHHSNTKQGNAHQQDSINNSNSINGDKISASLRRFVVKKGVLRLVEHTVLREVSSVQVPPNKTVAPNKNQANRNLALLTTNAHAPSQAMQEQVFEDDPANKNSSSHRRTFSEQQQSGNNTGNRSIKSRMMATFGKHQNQSAIYQEQNYHGSHSHLPFPGGGDSGTEIQQQQQNTKTRHQHQLSFPGGDAHQQQQQQQGDRRSIFKPNRHSMDVSMNPAMSGNSHSPRIVNSIEAKFKTEVMLLSLTPHLQRQERWYQHQLKNLISQTQGNSNHHAEQDKDFEDMYTEEEVAKEDIEDGVWQTTVWVSIPGPSAMATFTETKNIVKTHTFQLILLCGMSDENIPSAFTATPATDGNETEAGSAGSGSGSGSVSTVSLANVNKEFRLEMDLHVTGPRAPAEMSFRQPRKE